MVTDIMVIEESDGAPEHHLETLFKGDLFFMPVVRHLLGKAAGNSIAERQRAAHWAEGFMIEGGKLWKFSNRLTDRVAHTEC